MLFQFIILDGTIGERNVLNIFNFNVMKKGFLHECSKEKKQ
jgi:hypothetical protein